MVEEIKLTILPGAGVQQAPTIAGAIYNPNFTAQECEKNRTGKCPLTDGNSTANSSCVCQEIAKALKDGTNSIQVELYYDPFKNAVIFGKGSLETCVFHKISKIHHNIKLQTIVYTCSFYTNLGYDASSFAFSKEQVEVRTPFNHGEFIVKHNVAWSVENEEKAYESKYAYFFTLSKYGENYPKTVMHEGKIFFSNEKSAWKAYDEVEEIYPNDGVIEFVKIRENGLEGEPYMVRLNESESRRKSSHS